MKKNEFEQLIHQLKDQLYRFAFSILNSKEEAQDAVQEIVLRLWLQRKKLNREENIASFCMTMLRNYCFDQLRKQKQFQVFQQTHQHERVETSTMEQLDLVEQIRQQLKRLPEQQQLALQLKDFQGLEYTEIAQIMQLPVNAIRVHVSRGRRRLYHIFKGEYSL
ncbi:RNA polymerase sigma factor [uncultured Sunxiuqinia sp.]|uniref:RNA polymerase sigma factor n=1 Tax=uncultured Sunxiuqinia sp. TaxID=1573825 RepID=UPI0030DB114B|tara:strand:- start:14629 stop:15120 length:492 start_codon:yes stop_codon:yes gene_type:complete